MSRLRNRWTKATFWTDGELMRWPRDKRFVYKSLWAMAEDSCCIEDDPFEWKLTAWGSPMDADVTVELLQQYRDEFVRDGKAIPYANGGGKTYLYLPLMAEHEKPRNPQSNDLPLPPWVVYTVTGKGKGKRVQYDHGCRVCSLQNECGNRDGSPVLSCSVLPRPDLSSDKDKPVSLSVDEAVLGYWQDKSGREPKPDDLRSLFILCKTFGNDVVKLAIGQACVQGSSADSYGLITTIARAEKR